MKTLLIKFCLFNLFFIFCVDLYAQSDSLKIDSLKQVLQTQKEDTNKVNTLNDLSELSEQVFYITDHTIPMQYANSAIKLADKLNYKKGKGKSLINIGTICEDQSKYVLALENYYAALKLFKEIDDKRRVAISQEKIAGIYAILNNNSQALKSEIAALEIYQQLHSDNETAEALSSIADIYSSMNDYEKFLLYKKNALKIYERLKNYPGMGFAMLQIGSAYLKKDNYTEAIKYDSSALKIFRENGLRNYISVPYGYFGFVYEQEGDTAKSSGNFALMKNKYIKALEAYSMGLKFSLLKGGKQASYAFMARVYIKQKEFTKAKEYLNKAIQLGNELGNVAFAKSLYSQLTSVDSAMGNFRQAFEDHKMFVLYRDSTSNSESAKKVAELSMQHEFEQKQAIAKAEQGKKDAEAKRIKNQQYFAITALAIVVLAAIIIAMIQFRSNKHKQQANIALQQQKEKVESTLSELKSTQSQLIQSEKMASLGELTAGIAHEIQNPLNFVNNFSEVNKELLEELKEEANKGNIDEVKAIANDVIDNQEKINHHGKRADAIVKNMLQHSSTTKGVKEPKDINKLANEYLRLSYHGMRAKDKTFNADFKLDLDESIGKINIVPQDIGRVLLNLFNNAFYAVNERKRIADENYKPLVSIQTKKENDKIEIIVSDNGNGIPSSIKDKIFQPFFTTKPTGQGTGLGLSLAYDIITKEHNGTIKVNSKENEGSEFIITLPVI
jgi:two-component system, NtrC family, sensor kinase